MNRRLAWLRETVERLAEHPTDECVLWPFVTDSKGYGRLQIERCVVRATHVSLELSGLPRPLPPYDLALHSCDVPRCVNPAHLRWGTEADNIADKVSRRRHPHGEQTNTARLTDADVLDIRRRVRLASCKGCRDGNVGTLAREYGVRPGAIIRAAKGETWRHVDGVAAC